MLVFVLTDGVHSFIFRGYVQDTMNLECNSLTSYDIYLEALELYTSLSIYHMILIL